ncbi:MAG: hypothetical protein SF162_09825 [bacterium]|nr:hypothetical protein [bacterium]
MTRPEQTFGGILLIGLAILYLTGYWFPGILFVIGAAVLGRTYAEGHTWQHADARPALILIGVGLVFSLNVLRFIGGSWLPVLLVGIGAYLLFKDRIDAAIRGSGKRKP